MVETQIAFAVMAHHTRATAAVELSTLLHTAPVAVDDGTRGESANGLAAWRLAYDAATASGAEWAAVLQDDALPVAGFVEHAAAALARMPAVTCCSFYVGAGRPRAPQVANAVALADQYGAAWLRADACLWGPALALPTACVPDMLRWSASIDLPYDERVGVYASCVLGQPTYYTWPSLVDHADGPSLIEHADGQPRSVPRRAHRVGIPSYTTNVVIDI